MYILWLNMISEMQHLITSDGRILVNSFCTFDHQFYVDQNKSYRTSFNRSELSIVYHHLFQLNIAVVVLPCCLPFLSEYFLIVKKKRISSSVCLAKRFAIFNMENECVIMRVISSSKWLVTSGNMALLHPGIWFFMHRV